MLVKTADLTGAALDWAVAKCEGFGLDAYMRNIDIHKDVNGKVSCLLVPINREYVHWSPSTDWSQGGPIIEREGIDVLAPHPTIKVGQWCARCVAHNDLLHEFGPTPLIAAMRCYVASKLGDTIDIPEELLS